MPGCQDARIYGSTWARTRSSEELYLLRCKLPLAGLNNHLGSSGTLHARSGLLRSICETSR